MKCPKCGTDNQDGVRFCGNCGADLQAQQPTETQPVQPAVTQPLYAQVDETAQQSQPAQPTEQQPYAYSAAPQPDAQQFAYGAPQPAQQPMPNQPYPTGYQPAAPQKKGPSKGLIIGIVAAVVVVVALVVVLGGKKDEEPTPTSEPAIMEESTDGSADDSGNDTESEDTDTESSEEESTPTESADDNSAATALGVVGTDLSGVTLADRVTDTTNGYGFSFCPLPSMVEETTDGRLYYDSADPYMVAIAFGGENSDGDDAEGWADWFAYQNEDYQDFGLFVAQSDETTFTLVGTQADSDGNRLVVRGLVNSDTVQLLCIYYKADQEADILPSVAAVADSFQAGTGTGNE